MPFKPKRSSPASRSAPKPPAKSARKPLAQKPKRRKGPKPGTRYVSERHDRAAAVARHPKAAVTAVSRGPVTAAASRSANDILKEVGGEAALATILDDSDHPKAPVLADKLRSGTRETQELPFGRKLLDSGLSPRVLAEIIHDRQKTRADIQTSMDLPEIVAGIGRRAKDSFERCGVCQGHGKKLTSKQSKNQLPPSDDAPVCLKCDGVGWVLVGAEQWAIELHLELARLRKSGQQFDFSKKFLQQNQYNFGAGAGAGPGQAPTIDSIIRRADEQVLLPAPRATLSGTTSPEPQQQRSGSGSVIDAVLVDDTGGDMPEETRSAEE